MTHAFICDAIRTPIGRYGGMLSAVRADDFGAIPIHALMQRNSGVDWAAVDDVIYGCANQAGEDNRDVARMSALLAGLPVEVPGVTVNRLCGSGMDAIAIASRLILSGEADLVIAGGVESMSRAPYVASKSTTAFGRDMQLFDTTIGWRFVNPLMVTTATYELMRRGARYALCAPASVRALLWPLSAFERRARVCASSAGVSDGPVWAFQTTILATYPGR